MKGFGSAEFDRRRYPRLDFNLPVAFRNAENFSPEGVSRNISLGGLMVYLPQVVNQGQIIEVTMLLPMGEEKRVCKTQAEVVWAQSGQFEEGWVCRAGLRFLEMVPEASQIWKFERRVFPRFVIQVPFTYECNRQSLCEGTVQNVSIGGLQVYLAESIAPQSVLTLKLSLPKGKAVQHIQATARVVWIMQTKDAVPTFKAGLKFMSVSPEGLKYLKHFQELWLEQGG
jgi:c-di-GMP-binding flagellar brake protein YcgR